VGDLTIVVVDKLGGQFQHIGGFGAPEIDGFQVLPHGLFPQGQHLFRGVGDFEQGGGGFIDADIGGLGRQHNGDQQGVGVGVGKLRRRGGALLCQPPEHFVDICFFHALDPPAFARKEYHHTGRFLAMTDFSHLPYRPCVGVMLLNKDGLAFVAERIDSPGAWQMPQGGIDEGESPEIAAFRELGEEIGTENATILAKSQTLHTYDLPPDLVPKHWSGRYRGQAQHWFAMQFQGQDAEINIATPHPEFFRWQWTPLATLPDLIVPFKRHIYTALAAEFSGLIKA
jgi:putative (di)nucleoside polyphosphate hydrolase